MSQSFKNRFINWLVSPGFLRPVFRLLRRVCPILVFGKRAVITRHADVIEVLTRDNEIIYDGPFPDRLILEFDTAANGARD